MTQQVRSRANENTLKCLAVFLFLFIIIYKLRRMFFSGMLRRADLVRIDVSEECRIGQELC
jgi:hypothetical protein